MNVLMVGEGAFANKHMDAIAHIDDATVVGIVGGVAEATQKVAEMRGLKYWSTSLEEGLNQPGVDAVILATPTPMHASQAIQVLDAGKHVLVEIPMADNLADSEALVKTRQQTGLVAMAVAIPT